MRVSIGLLFVAFHVIVGSPIGEDCFQDGLAKGTIRYVDSNGVQREVEYTYPKPTYTVQHLSYEGQRRGENPFLNRIAGQEYNYQGASDNQAAREQHFRIWNQRRYQALKNEADKMYAEGKEPSSDLLARLRQYAANAQNPETIQYPEMIQDREEHLRIWNDARLNVLNLQGRSYSQNAGDHEHLRLYDEQIQFLKKIEHDNARGQQQVQPQHFRSYENQVYNPQFQRDKKEHWAQNVPSSYYTPSQNALHSYAAANAAHQQARDEHFRLYNKQLQLIHSIEDKDAKIHLKVDDRYSREHVRPENEPKVHAVNVHQYKSDITGTQAAAHASHLPALKSAGSHQLGADISNRFVEEPLAQNVQATHSPVLKSAAVPQAGIQTQLAEKAPSAEQTNVLGTSPLKSKSETTIRQEQERTENAQKIYERDYEMSNQEKLELEAEELREKMRLREEQKRLELDALKEAERLKEEQKQMKAEQMLIKATDEARLQKDLKHQFDGEHVRTIGTEVLAQPGVYLLSSNYQTPYLYQYNTPAAAVRFASSQPQYLKYPGSQAYAIQSSGQQLQPSFIQPAAKFIPQTYLPATIGSAEKAQQQVRELEQATRDHFLAHEVALKQLELANQKAATKDCTY